jgi:hypothetical protein
MKAETLSALTRLNMLEGETLPDRACELLEAGLDPPPHCASLRGWSALPSERLSRSFVGHWVSLA